MDNSTCLSPATLARLNDARQRLANTHTLRASLDRWHEKLARENPALTATEVGEAWFQIYARSGVCLDACRRELDELLDGELEKAEASRRVYFIAGNALESHVDEFERALPTR